MYILSVSRKSSFYHRYHHLSEYIFADKSVHVVDKSLGETKMKFKRVNFGWLQEPHADKINPFQVGEAAYLMNIILLYLCC